MNQNKIFQNVKSYNWYQMIIEKLLSFSKHIMIDKFDIRAYYFKNEIQAEFVKFNIENFFVWFWESQYFSIATSKDQYCNIAKYSLE